MKEQLNFYNVFEKLQRIAICEDRSNDLIISDTDLIFINKFEGVKSIGLKNHFSETKFYY